jgi:hypothetical protein
MSTSPAQTLTLLIFVPHQEPQVCRGSNRLMVIEGVNLVLTAEQVFGWLRI